MDYYKKRIIFQSSHRGSKELDLLLTNFTNVYLDKLSDEEIIKYYNFLHLSDQDIYNIIMQNDNIEKCILDLIQ